MKLLNMPAEITIDRGRVNKCLQEFAIDGKDAKKGLITETEVKKILSDYPYHVITHIGNPEVKHSYGLACYSKFPIKNARKLTYPNTVYNGTVIYELDIDGKRVTLVNNHLESNSITAEDKRLYAEFFEQIDRGTLDKVAHNVHQKLGVAYKKREVQVEILREELNRIKADASIICGDFNDTPFSYTYATVKGDLIDAFANSGFGAGISYNENMFLFRIDYILHSQNIESYNCTVDRVNYSDHYPIWSYLKFKD